jgi:hypothetical protein
VPSGGASHQSQPWHAQILYEYNVKPEDLK